MKQDNDVASSSCQLFKGCRDDGRRHHVPSRGGQDATAIVQLGVRKRLLGVVFLAVFVGKGAAAALVAQAPTEIGGHRLGLSRFYLFDLQNLTLNLFSQRPRRTCSSTVTSRRCAWPCAALPRPRRPRRQRHPESSSGGTASSEYACF